MGWEYRPGENKVIDPSDVKHVVALVLRPEDGPVLAMAARMEAAMRKGADHWEPSLGHCCCKLCKEARTIIAEIDAAKAKGGGA